MERKIDEPTSWKKIITISLIGGAVFMFMFPNWTSADTIWLWLQDYSVKVSYFIVLWKANEGTVRLLNQYISWFEKPVLRFIISTIATIFATVISIIFLQIIFAWLFYKVSPIKVLQGFSSASFTYTILITTAISMFIHGRAFLLGWRDTAIEVEKLKQANIEAQYETLKNQVNPHFLFNSLNVLSNLVYKDQDLAAKFIKQLSKVYRYVLDTRQKQVVTLTQELEALESYIFLMRIRFGENLIVHQNISPQPHEQIVPLTLQMLLENAIKHNEISKAFPLTIQINRLEDDIISMKNNLQAKQQLHEKSGVGLENIKARFTYISDKKVEILPSETTFEVKIPIVRMD